MRLIGVFCVIVGLSALGACSPSPTFDSISASFARLESDFASTVDNTQPQTKPDENEIVFPQLAYQRTTPDELADRGEINGLISKYARHYGVPERLVHRVVNRESTYNPQARNGIHLGLMQLNPQTARTMGYRGPDIGLLDADTNLRYGVKYLRGALMVAEGNHDRADKLYQTGYYYHAKRMGLLQATGLRP